MAKLVSQNLILMILPECLGGVILYGSNGFTGPPLLFMFPPVFPTEPALLVGVISPPLLLATAFGSKFCRNGGFIALALVATAALRWGVIVSADESRSVSHHPDCLDGVMATVAAALLVLTTAADVGREHICLPLICWCMVEAAKEGGFIIDVVPKEEP